MDIGLDCVTVDDSGGFFKAFLSSFQVFRVLDVLSIGRAEEKNFNGGFMEEKYLSYLDGRKQLYGR